MKKMEENKIYLPLQGRIGNQLFQYAFARKLQLEMPNNPKIIMDDSDIIRCNWENSLMYYDLPNVEYIHESILENRFVMSKQYFLRKIYRVLTRKKNYMDKFKMEAAAEVGVNLKEGYNGDLSSREAGSVGGQMVKKMLESYEKTL